MIVEILYGNILLTTQTLQTYLVLNSIQLNNIVAGKSKYKSYLLYWLIKLLNLDHYSSLDSIKMRYCVLQYFRVII